MENLWSITGARLAISPAAIVSLTTPPRTLTALASGPNAVERIDRTGGRSPSICSQVACGFGSVKNLVVMSSMLPIPRVAALKREFHVE